MTFNWTGDDKKRMKLKFNSIYPVFHSRLMDETEIKCCCGRSLRLHSPLYVFRITTKKEGKIFYIHVGESCGRRLIELSNEINNTLYRNIYFVDPCQLNNEVSLIQGYGLGDCERSNDPARYTRFNKAYLVAIYILCQSWKQPFPYGPLAESIDAIHAKPEEDCFKNLGFFNKIIEKDKRKLSEMLDEYRSNNKNAFPNLQLSLLHNYIINVLMSESNIIRV